MSELDRKRKADAIAVILSTAGVLFFIAMAFGVLPFKYAMFFGVACFIVATMTRRLMMREN